MGSGKTEYQNYAIFSYLSSPHFQPQSTVPEFFIVKLDTCQAQEVKQQQEDPAGTAGTEHRGPCADLSMQRIWVLLHMCLPNLSQMSLWLILTQNYARKELLGNTAPAKVSCRNTNLLLTMLDALGCLLCPHNSKKERNRIERERVKRRRKGLCIAVIVWVNEVPQSPEPLIGRALGGDWIMQVIELTSCLVRRDTFPGV